MVIQMIRVSDDNSLFIYGLNEAGELVFRTTHNINLLRNEPIYIHQNKVYVGVYDFDKQLLEKVIKSNEKTI